MGNRRKHLLPEPVPQKQRPFLIAGRATPSLTAGKGYEKLLLAIWTADTSDLAKTIKKVRPKAGILYEAEAKLTAPL
jgi:hypothetical protein